MKKYNTRDLLTHGIQVAEKRKDRGVQRDSSTALGKLFTSLP